MGLIIVSVCCPRGLDLRSTFDLSSMSFNEIHRHCDFRLRSTFHVRSELYVFQSVVRKSDVELTRALMTFHKRISCCVDYSKSRIFMLLQRIYATDLVRPDTLVRGADLPPARPAGSLVPQCRLRIGKVRHTDPLEQCHQEGS